MKRGDDPSSTSSLPRLVSSIRFATTTTHQPSKRPRNVVDDILMAAAHATPTTKAAHQSLCIRTNNNEIQIQARRDMHSDSSRRTKTHEPPTDGAASQGQPLCTTALLCFTPDASVKTPLS
ncbi:hypothetical protein E2C01_099619 [Portunus trituberculatus]|uniref:Uncharacterized protein n=1 Tax=Portunus trituberculatus TaxID=210409 RepID=A0A5B7KFE2_PORTR|nr:hypothetical protein [Portunus trituberculatus]